MILSVAGVRFSYNSHPVLRDVGFDLPGGKILGLLGTNGAGKSTLLKCLNRILRPERATIQIGGRDISSMHGNEIARHFGYVPQRYGEGLLTVFDEVLLGRRPYIGWRATRHDLEVVEEILKLMGLQDLAYKQTDRLSGGELQKVILARALAQEPEVLLLDEPTSNLDLKNQLQVMDLVRQIVDRQGLSAVVAIHDINLAFRYADYFLMLKQGKIHTLAPREEITPEIIQDVYGVEVIFTHIEGYTLAVPR